jgi:hypothetical protein
MRAAVVAFACLVAMAVPAHAGLVEPNGGTAAVLPGGGGSKAYDPAGPSDPWRPGQAVVLGATPSFQPSVSGVRLTYVGREAGWTNTFELATGEVLFANGTSRAGDSVSVSVDAFLSAVFRSKGKGAGFGLGSERVAASFAGDVLQLGFDDGWGGDHDYDDLRIQAEVVPVPAALPLLASACAGLWGYRRLKTRAG